MSEHIEVKVSWTYAIPARAAEQICANFLEWLEGQGWMVAPNSEALQLAVDDDTYGYADMAADFVKSRTEGGDGSQG
jgi:hypothetical protein